MNCIEFVQLSAARIFCVVSQLRSSSSSRRARQFQICVQSHSLRLTRGQTNQTNLKTGILHCRSSQLSRWALLSHRRSSKKSPNSLQSHFLHHYSRLVKKVLTSASSYITSNSISKFWPLGYRFIVLDHDQFWRENSSETLFEFHLL